MKYVEVQMHVENDKLVKVQPEVRERLGLFNCRMDVSDMLFTIDYDIDLQYLERSTKVHLYYSMKM